MGSVVFPDARLKIFLTASVAERARRRYKQLKEKGMDVSLAALSRDMEARDRRDSERAVAPLRACDDARVLDSTHLGIGEVVEIITGWARDAYASQG
jgi:cytidylate kinase